MGKVGLGTLIFFFRELIYEVIWQRLFFPQPMGPFKQIKKGLAISFDSIAANF